MTSKTVPEQQSKKTMEEVTSAISFLLLPLLFFIFIHGVVKFRKLEATKCYLPPSPPRLPLIGNLHQLQGSVHRALHSLAQKHGPIIFLRLGRVPTVVVSSANLARDVLKTYDHVLSSRPSFMVPRRLLYDKDIAYAAYGEYWREVRKICVLQLLSPQKVQSSQFVREAEVATMLEKIKDHSSSNSTVNMTEMFITLTSNIISMVALGKKYYEGERARKFVDSVKEFTYLVGATNIGDFIPSLAWLNHLNGLNARVERAFEYYDNFLNEVIEDHLKKEEEGRDVDYEDFVDVLLRIEKDCTLGVPLARDSTKAIILDMFGAGTDTSAVALEWAMSELLRHPEIMKEVQKEVRYTAKGKLLLKESDIKGLHYLKSVIKETLRLHIPGPILVPHELTESVKIQGYDIPPRTQIIVNAYSIGRDPSSWEEPEKFWPNRFLTAGGASVDFKGQDFQFIPFGAGRRGCPGTLFAASTLELALANVLNLFDWELPNGMNGEDLDMQEALGITVHRKNDLVLAAKQHYY